MKAPTPPSGISQIGSGTDRRGFVRALAAAALGTQARANDISKKETATCQPLCKVVLVKKGFIDDDDPDLNAFAEQLGVQKPTFSARNPVCCTWIGPLEIDVHLAGEHYLVFHYGFTIIQVTSPKALSMLAEDIKKHPGSNGDCLPHGVWSSFRNAEK
ncbi:MAG TPA: hypothetical protein VMF06_13125 [Candidatus Limnocylindria bacterium]|jgi:hypothetical protein|nr:hypothetical protein [Candidatus Limnocylindria bacterium]